MLPAQLNKHKSIFIVLFLFLLLSFLIDFKNRMVSLENKLQDNNSILLQIQQNIEEIDEDLKNISIELESLKKDIELIEQKDVLNEVEADETTIEENKIPKVSRPDQSQVTNDEIINYIYYYSEQYQLKPTIIYAMVEKESGFNPNATNGQYKGLLQISERWHSSRMNDLGVTDLYDPESNIKVACDYLKDLLDVYEDYGLVLMMYSMDNNKAMELYRKGELSSYAKSILARSEELEAN